MNVAFANRITMMNKDLDLIIINGVVVTAEEIRSADVAIKSEKIVAVEECGTLEKDRASKVIDAEGGWVMPGGVDAHVHLQEPQLFGKGSSADTFESGTRSAVCGGTTTIIAFAPQTKNEDSLLDTLHATRAKADGNSYADYSLHLLVSNPSARALSEFSALREAGISSLKIYMTYEVLKLNDGQILDVLLEARRHKITTLIHAENDDLILWMTKKLEERNMLAPKYHATSHPAMAEVEATYRAICLSEFVDVPILLVHVSSPVAADHIRTAQGRGLPVFAETCPQYLFLTKHDLDKPGFEGARCVCSPPPRESEVDHEGIWKGLEDGTFTVLSSDHCPFRYNDNQIGKKTCITDEYPNGHFKYIPNGIPGVETRLPLALSADRLDLKKFVEVTSTNAAKLYGLYPRKGVLIPGKSDADITIWYPPRRLEPFVLKAEMLHHDCDYTPYEGKFLRQWPRYTILRGEVVWDRDNGGLRGNAGQGHFLHREPSSLKGSLSDEEWDIRGF